MAAEVAALSTSTTPSTRSLHSLKVSAPTNLTATPSAGAGKAATGGRQGRAGGQHSSASSDAQATACGSGQSSSIVCCCQGEGASRPAAPPAKASTLDSVTRSPHAKDCAMALAPADKRGSGGSRDDAGQARGGKHNSRIKLQQEQEALSRTVRRSSACLSAPLQ